MKLSIVIPTYNRAELLSITLCGFCAQTDIDRIAEILIVSDGSTDATAEVVAGFHKCLPVRLITLPKGGVSKARNRGLQEAVSSVVLFLDDDVVPSPLLVAEHIRFHTENENSMAALLGYVTWLPELHVSPFMRWYGEFGGLFAYSFMDSGKEIDRRYLYTCNLSLKADFLKLNGGLNEGLTVFEDYELGFRLAKAGMKLTFMKSALGYHNQTFTFAKACERIRKYSGGFSAFYQTEAGIEMRNNRSTWKNLLDGVASSSVRCPWNWVSQLLNSDVQLPHAVYRFAYWYFATLTSQSFRERQC